MTAATARQLEILAALVRLTADGWPASVREVAQAVGHASPSTTHDRLLALEAAGLAGRHPRGLDGWRPTPAGRDAVR